MVIPKTIGLPRMGKEKGERRVFLPEFAQWLTALGATVLLEEGYGSSGGYDFADYRQGNAAVHAALPHSSLAC
jgi:alanine dehydrogenase